MEKGFIVVPITTFFENKEKQKVFCKAIKLKVELCSR